LQLVGQLLADASQFHADIVFGDAENFGHLLITQPVEVHQRERSVHFRKLPDGGVQSLKSTRWQSVRCRDSTASSLRPH